MNIFPRALMLAAMLPVLGVAQSAQAGIADGELPQRHGAGVKFADGHSFHPGAAIALGWDSNVFSTRAPNPVRRAFFGLASLWAVVESRPTLGGYLDVPVHDNARPVEYHVGALGAFRFHMTPDTVVREDANKLNFGARLRVVFGPNRPVSVFLTDDFYRRAEQARFEGGAPLYDQDRKENQAVLGLRIRPGGGRLTVETAAVSEVLWYDSERIYNADRLVIGTQTQAKWRFVDRSAFYLRHDYRYYYYTYFEDQPTGQMLSPNQDSNEHEFVGGFRGQLGRRWTLDAGAGFRNMRFIWDRGGPHFKGFVFDAAVGFFPTEGLSFRLGAHRSAHNSVLGNFHLDLGGDVRVTYLAPFGLSVDASANLVRREYNGLPQPGNDDPRIESYVGVRGSGNSLRREDDLLELNLALAQEIARVVVLGLDYRLTLLRSDFAAIYEKRLYGDRVDYADFRRNQLQFTVAVRY